MFALLPGFLRYQGMDRPSQQIRMGESEHVAQEGIRIDKDASVVGDGEAGSGIGQGVAQFLFATARRADAAARAVITDVNGEPALLMRADGEHHVRLVLSIGIDHGRVYAIRAIRNPDKLQDLNRALQASQREPSAIQVINDQTKRV